MSSKVQKIGHSFHKNQVQPNRLKFEIIYKRHLETTPSSSYDNNSCDTNLNSQQKSSSNDIHKAKQTPRDVFNDSVKKIAAFKQSMSKDINFIPVMGKPGSGVRSNKSFKPKLEDIKSSMLLLNKKNVQADPDIPKPKPVEEWERIQKLREAKEKFRSKDFWNDAKYDNIEGLNWISWK
ncbi:uncharacterized protein LOC113240002 [Hyposmocoma kahamanoa]|uniref:uncharacterized protein LOC113240002 n=1 Tax=Hyposmocoma kahamanoa TaxID=1477025 RepID=UPI000E6D5F30|nr:uncharacterized protein LOC113240002 [Hyposmocoma kahamanoa]